MIPRYLPAQPSYGQIARQSAPLILANCAVPLLGLVDTAVIGQLGSVQELGAIALGALIFNFLYWAFGFLRMGTAGFTAQAAGADDPAEVRAGLGRALGLALSIGLCLWLLQGPLSRLCFALFDASPVVEAAAQEYLSWRIWGAPAALANFALLGLLIGLGRSAQVLLLQCVLNGLNLGLDLFLAVGLGWGLKGIAAGTALAEWLSLGLGLWLVLGELRRRHADAEPFWPWDRLRDIRRLRTILAANLDLMLRTLLMLGAFAWFTNQGARFGDTQLAANHLLLQFISFSAFFLDGYAFASETLVGRALGARNRRAFDAAVWRSSVLALLTALLLACTLALTGAWWIQLLTDLPSVRSTASLYLPYAALYVLISVAAFQLDGIFIGCTRTRAMRNASAASVGGFALAWWLLGGAASNHGLWQAFVLYVLLRGLSLGLAFPALRRSIDPEFRPPRP